MSCLSLRNVSCSSRSSRKRMRPNSGAPSPAVRAEPGNYCRTKNRDGENNISTMDVSSSSSSSSSSSIKGQNKNDVWTRWLWVWSYSISGRLMRGRRAIASLLWECRWQLVVQLVLYGLQRRFHNWWWWWLNIWRLRYGGWLLVIFFSSLELL
jgi:hypothetical protein